MHYLEGLREHFAIFQQDFLSANPYTRTVEANWTDFKNIIMQGLQKFIPQKQVRSSNHIPWLSRQIKHKIKERKRLYNIAKQKQTCMGISCYLKLIKFTRAQVKLTWAQALVGPGVDTPLIIVMYILL